MTRLSASIPLPPTPTTVSLCELAIAAGTVGQSVAIQFQDFPAHILCKLWQYSMNFAGPSEVRHVRNQSDIRKLPEACGNAKLVVVYSDKLYSDHAVRRGTIDMDSFPVEVFGHQAGAAYNGYYRKKIYHPLVASFSVAGDYDSTREGLRLGNGFIHAILRRGNAHTAEGCLRFLDRVLELAPNLAYLFDLRLDAGFMIGRVLDYLAQRQARFLGRLKSNPVLDRLAQPHLTRPVGRPPREGYERVVELGLYQAETWAFPQRLLLVVIDDPDPKTGLLFQEPDYFFLLSGWNEAELDGDACLAHYRKRGTFEDRLGEFNQALGVQLSSPVFRENEATFLLSLLAFNLGNMLRNELEDSLGGCWDLQRFRDSVLKVGGRVTKHSKRLIVHLAQSVVAFWQRLVHRITDWHLRPRFPRHRAPATTPWRPPPRHAHLVEVLRD